MKILKSGIRDVKAGENVTVVEPVNLYECTLHDGVFVGPFVEIQRNCIIGTGTRIQSHSFLCEKITIGKNCFIGHGVTFANDLFHSGKPDANPENWISITLGDNVVIGSGSAILTKFICSGTVIGAGSVVTKDIVKPGIYAGNPARWLRAVD
ncbi:acyltransferase [Dryocola sp. BD626]|uniref:acyltransferase n=1 Tax=Dryocola sp. BD626 TaxID=3133273 RepID=UPI003F4FC302